MAVQIKKKSLTIVSLVTRVFEANEAPVVLSKAQEIESAGYKLATSPTLFSITSPTGDDGASIPLKMELVMLVMGGKLGPAPTNLVKEKIINLVDAAYESYILDDMPPHLAFTNYTAPSATVTDGVFMTSNEEPAVADKTPKIDAMKDSTVQLKNATKIYQPVFGTGTGSVYHVIAISDAVAIAARVRNDHTIAIRAEILVHSNSTGGKAAKEGLIAAGLDKKDKGHYSLHLDPQDFNMVKRSIGSTLFASGLEFDAVVSDLKSIQGAGK
jgi:hypothetical protein